MKSKWIALLLALCLLPVAALAEQVTADEDSLLPYGLALGMDAASTEALLKSDSALKGYEIEDYENGTYYFTVSEVGIPDTDLTAASFQIQVDTNNSVGEERLTSVYFDMYGMNDSIDTFRVLLKALSAKFGEPTSDPFSAEAIDLYEEWGSLDASWQTDTLRVSLTLSRMYDASISVQYSSRKNYDKADLAE